jgi:endonuclease/exonuclease/phosphatase (EEP) superfamily protein YafD
MIERMSRLRQSARLVVASGLVLTIVLGSLGQIVRDRSVALALLLYLPLVLFGLAAVGFDAICRGRALPRGRFALGAIGLIGTIGGAWPMVGLGPLATVGDAQSISVLHWNVLWGGGKDRKPAKWAAIRSEILRQGADLVVLSEAPPDDWLNLLVGEMGPGATRVQVENGPEDAYWFKLAVFSKGPLRLVRPEPIADGAGMVVEAEVRGRLARLLVVDARSNPLLAREPRLLDVADACRRARESGEPFDVVLGDFNTPSRCLGFDAIEAEGYALAARSCRGWRGTFPAVLPIYDIDHIFINRDDPLLECRLFTNFASDHRGQVARFRPAHRAPKSLGGPGLEDE